MSAVGLRAFYDKTEAIKGIDMPIRAKRVTAIIGPSGCGKSTFLRCFNRMHEVIPRASVAGQVLLDGEDIYGASIDPVRVRRYVGMVFQKPTRFRRCRFGTTC